MVIKVYKNIIVKFHCDEIDLKATNLIYLLKFPNGKYYVGQTNTKFGLVNRIQGHCYESYNNKKKRNTYKDNIISKYKQFDVFILKKCDISEIDYFEIFYINLLKRKLINIELGGCLNKIISDKTKEKIGEKSRKYQLEHPMYNKINVYDLEGNFVRSHYSKLEVKKYYNTSQITVNNALYKNNRIFLKKYQIFRDGTEKIVDYTKKVKTKPKRKPNNPNEIVFKYNKKSGMFIEKVNIGVLDSQKRYQIKQSIKNNSIHDGFVWSYNQVEKVIPPKTQYEKISEKLSRPVLQLDDDLNIIKKWNNVREAGEFYGDKKGELIRQVCIRWRRHTKGYTWCYEDEYEWYKTMWKEKLIRKR